MTPLFHGTVDKTGKLALNNRRRISQYLHSIVGKAVQITIEPVRNTRSQNQNRYYWGVVIKMISVRTGHTDEEVHAILASKFLKEGVDFRGKRYEVVKSTTSLTTIGFEDYLEKCRTFAAIDLELIIPLPNEIVVMN